MDLKTEEARLLALLLPLENEASRLLLSYEDMQSQLEALRQELTDVRSKLLENFLTEHLTPKLLSYTIKEDITGETLIGIVPVEGGELEFEKLKSVIKLTDTNNIPLFYVLNYIGKGLPYG